MKALLARASSLVPPWLRAAAPWLLLAGIVLFNLVTLRAERLAAFNLNDGGVHISMIRWAAQMWSEGQIPLDGWFPHLAFGFAQFHQYQSLPHILTGALAVLVDPIVAYSWTLYILLATWPVSVFLGARLLNRSRWEAAAAALVAPLVVSLPGYGFETGTYIWIGLGAWSQLWAMWTLPLAWGFCWQAIAHRRHLVPAAVFVALTIAFHFITGYLALLSVGAMLLAKPTLLKRRLVPAAVVGVGAVLIASWVTVPVLTDAAWASRSQYGEEFYGSFGAGQILEWLVTGRLFDAGRLPVLTLLVAAGLWASLRRTESDGSSRAPALLLVLSLVLFFGRPTLGLVTNLLPGGQDLFFHRFVMGVHLAGIVLAGMGAVHAVKLLSTELERGWGRLERPAWVAVCVGLIGLALLPALLERAGYTRAGRDLIQAQIAADQQDGRDFMALVEQSQQFGPGRIYAGTIWGNNFGDEYRIGRVPAYAVLLHADTDAVGFTLRTLSLSSDVEVLFDFDDPGHYDLFYVRYLILPQDMEPPVPATLLDSAGRHRLWGVSTAGYLACVDTIGPVLEATRSNLGQQVQPYLNSDLPEQRIHRMIEFPGASVDAPTLPEGPVAPGPPCTMDEQSVDLANGRASAAVTASRDGVLLFKSTFHGRWSVTVDGEEATALMLTPSFLGVQVPPGEHSVEFVYEPFPYPGLFILGAVALGAVALLGRGLRSQTHIDEIEPARSTRRPRAAARY